MGRGGGTRRRRRGLLGARKRRARIAFVLATKANMGCHPGDMRTNGTSQKSTPPGMLPASGSILWKLIQICPQLDSRAGGGGTRRLRRGLLGARRRMARICLPPPRMSHPARDLCQYRATSIIRNHALLGPYSRLCLGPCGGPMGGPVSDKRGTPVPIPQP